MKQKIVTSIHAFNDDVTGSCMLYTVRYPNNTEENLLFDCGLRQGENTNTLNYSLGFIPANIDHVINTHDHIDHNGYFPSLVANGYNGKFYLTPLAAQTSKISLTDSLKIMKMDHKQTKLPVLYTDCILTKTLKKFVTIDYNEATQISNHLFLTFCGNGHMLGAAAIFLEARYPNCEPVSIFVLGDYLPNNIFFTPPAMPNYVTRAKNLTFIQETTYANSSKCQIVKKFNKDITSYISSGNNICLPCLAKEKPEKLLYNLKLLQESGALPTNIKIYIVSPLLINYLEVYNKNSITQFMPQNVEKILPTMLPKIMCDTHQKIIIATSGMLDKGPIQDILPSIISKSNWVIYITCYQPKDNAGNILLNAKKGDNILLFNSYHTLQATVDKTDEFSSHARYEDFVKLLNSFDSIAFIGLTHGEKKVRLEYKKMIMEKQGFKIVENLDSKHTFIIDSNGLIESKVCKIPNFFKLKDFSYDISIYDSKHSIKPRYKRTKKYFNRKGYKNNSGNKIKYSNFSNRLS